MDVKIVHIMQTNLSCHNAQLQNTHGVCQTSMPWSNQGATSTKLEYVTQRVCGIRRQL